MSLKKKSCIIIFLVVILNSMFFSSSLASDKQGTFELIIGNYSMSEPRFKAVYQKGGLIEGFSLSIFIIRDLDFYFEMRGFYKSGELTYTKEKTHFLLIPVSLGIQYNRSLGLFCPYLGLGIDYYFYAETNPIRTIINYTRGIHFQGGSYFKISEKSPVWLDLKLKYTSAKTEENNLEIQLGGFEFGLGLVLVF